MFHLNATNIPALQHYLQAQNWLAKNEAVIAATKPGEGNMNYVLRIDTGTRKFIIKQARSYVEKFPQIPAPVERALVEAAFYTTIQSDDLLHSYTPKLLGVDAANSVIILEDLGTANDYSYLYNVDSKLTEDEVGCFVAFINQLHNNIPKNNNQLLVNYAMRQLNHQHIFIFPFVADNGFNLDEVQDGLQALAKFYQTDVALRKLIKAVGEIYLQNGDILLHGDYYPGSWLRTNNGIKIIDPEFCFYGRPEFDIAVMIAHCMLTLQDDNLITFILATYQKKGSFNQGLMNKFIGIEIMRRLIGLAQLPLKLSLEDKEILLQKAHILIHK